MKEINERLTNLKIKMRERERLKSILFDVKEQKNKAEERKKNLSKQLKKEKIDVEKLEGLSFSNFLNTIIGKKVEKLAKEKSEFISAKLSYDTASTELESLKGEIERLETKILDIGDVSSEYDRLIKEKESILMNESSDFKNKLDCIVEGEAKLTSEKKELNEAIQAGNELLYSLQRVQESLTSAGNWGTWDIFGGGLISTMAKHSRIDDAQNEINNAQYLIKRFHRELQDIGGEMNLSIEIGSFLTFADYFFDGFFSDLEVQSKIRDAQSKVSGAIYKVEKVIKNLNRRLGENDRKLEELIKERVSIIEGYK
jgi:DNA repair exonuclease SbcCD ATPase subunit